MLTVRWQDPRGKNWNLTTGAEGVKLDMNNSDFMAGFNYIYDDSGDYLRGVRLGRIAPNLAVQINPNLTGSQWYQVHTEWWNLAQSTTKLGRLSIDRPDGTTVYIGAKLANVPGTNFPYDPGMKFAEPPVEPWALTSDYSHWLDTKNLQFGWNSGFGIGTTSNAVVSGDELDLSRVISSADLEILKSSPIYPWYSFRNVKRDAAKMEFGPKANLMKLTTQAKGKTYIGVITDPRFRTVSLDNNVPAWDCISGPIGPLAEDLRVVLPKDTASIITIILHRRYAAPF